MSDVVPYCLVGSPKPAAFSRNESRPFSDLSSLSSTIIYVTTVLAT